LEEVNFLGDDPDGFFGAIFEEFLDGYRIEN